MDWPRIRKGALSGWNQFMLAPRILVGRFQPGLARIASAKVSEQLRESKVTAAYRYPLPKRCLLWMTAQPLATLAGVTLFYAATIAVGAFGLLPSIALAADDSAGFRDFWTVNVAMLTVQAALVGLVFPLVIAFVGLLNQGRASFASRLTIYIEATGSIFVGVSSLLLCLAIAAELLFAARVSNAAAGAMTLLNLTWLGVNIAALGYFILRTVAFLHPARRTPLIRAYVANVVWPRELMALVTRNHWDGAVAYGHLPGGDEGPDGETGARTWYSSLGAWGEPRVHKQLASKKRLVDIRFKMIESVVRRWLADVRPLAAEAQHDFVLPVEPGQDYEGQRTLARATTALGPVSRFAISHAFKFRRVREDHGAVEQTARLLREMMADLLALIDGRQAEEFSVQLDEILDFHLFLYELAQCHDEDFSYALLGAGRGLFGYSETLGPNWAKAYRDVVQRAVERLADDPAFASRLAHVSQRLYGRAAATVMPKALEPLIHLEASLAYRLMDWASGPGDRTGTDTARPAHRDEYGEAWRAFVAGWEGLLREIGSTYRRRDAPVRQWPDFQRIGDNVILHLRVTTEIAARAVWIDDRTAARWACDLLLHWNIQAEQAWGTRGAYWRLQQESLTIALLDRPWSEVEPLGEAPAGTMPAPALMFGAAVQNAWRDHLITLACLFIHWSIHLPSPTGAPTAARMLLQNEPHDHGDTGLHGDTPFTGTEILGSILRIQGGGARWEDDSYAGRFDHLLEQLGKIGDAPSVSMRIYSLGGGLSFEALPLAIILAILATSPQPQGLDGELRRQLTQGNDQALLRIKPYLEALIAAAGEANAVQHLHILAAISDLEAADFETRLGHARRLVAEALAVLDGHREQAIADAPIDPARIAAVAAAAGADAFAPNRFPFNLFGAVEPTDAELTPQVLQTGGLSKGSYTDPLMGHIVINEDDWWRRMIAERIAAFVWWDISRGLTFEDIDARTSDDFWHAIRDAAKRMQDHGLTPILVLANASFPEWLRDWRWPYGDDVARKPDDLVITDRALQVEGYALHLNDIAVYEAPTVYGAAYLMPAEVLRRVRFHDYDGKAVDLEFEPDPEDRWKGSMLTSFQRDIELAEMTAYRIRFADPVEAPVADG